MKIRKVSNMSDLGTNDRNPHSETFLRCFLGYSLAEGARAEATESRCTHRKAYKASSGCRRQPKEEFASFGHQSLLGREVHITSSKN